MTKRILLADDSVTIQKVVELTFTPPEFEVTAVGNGDEALGLIDTIRPHLVIADVHMPGATGLEIARRVKQGPTPVPVLVLVGTFEPFDQSEIDASGADGHLKKPFDSQDLLATGRELVARATVGPAEPDPGPPPAEEAAPPESAEAAAEPTGSETPTGDAAALSDAQVDAIARRVVELLGDGVLRDVAWEVVPDLAEIVIRDRLRELEAQVDPVDS